MKARYDFGEKHPFEVWTRKAAEMPFRYHADDGKRVRTAEDMRRCWLYWTGEA